MDDVYQVREIKEEKDIKVEYSQPKFWHRCMANLVDFFIFVVVLLGLFIGARAAVQATDSYKNVQAKIDNIQLNSGIYRRALSDTSTTNNIDIIYYIDTYLKNTPAGKEFDIEIDENPQFLNGICVKAIKIFVNYCHENCSEARYEDLLTYYDNARLKPTLNGIHYFILDESNNVVPNTTLTDDATKLKYYYKKVYKPFIEDRCIPFLSANVPGYHDLLMYDYKMLLLVELPISYLLAGTIVYFIPPLFFKRGRKTLGKALYHIGLLDSRILSPTVPRFLVRFLIFMFGELVLSLFTFGIPYIISFSMMAFSKKRQGFPDYMVKTIEVDTSKANIYMDYVEAATKNQLHGKAIDFNLEKPL